MIALATTSSGMTAITEASLIADVIRNELSQAAAGHCVRVNHLSSTLADAVADTLVRHPSPANLVVRILGRDSSRAITADEAIEIRNRKQGVFCLFVPAGAHDATVSSLGNSFAELNGASLIESAYTMLINSPLIASEVKHAVKEVRSNFQTVGAAFRPTTTELLQFALAAHQRFQADGSETFGLDLWHVGLMPDAGEDFENRLGRNRRAVAEISRPARFVASLDDRIDRLNLTAEARSRARQLLRNENLQDTKTWTKAVASAPGGTFDQWTPLENPEPSDCTGVSIVPFRDQNETLSKSVRGLIQEGPGQPLFAPIGEKKLLKIWWETAPRNTNVPQWLLEIVPAVESSAWNDDAVELPSKIIKKGSQKQGSISLDLGLLDSDDLPQAPMRVRITAISEAGEELNSPSGELLEAISDEFFFTKASDGPGPLVRESRRNTPTLAGGILRSTIESGIDPGEVSSPTWIKGEDATTFTLRASARDIISMSFSSILSTLEARTLEVPAGLGLWVLEQSETFATSIENIRKLSDDSVESEEKKAFVRARRAFFSQLLREEVRNRIQVAEWTSTLVDLAIKHARSWSRWLASARGRELEVARSVDTLRLIVGIPESPAIDATVILPTHPLRTLWFSSHATLLRHWSDDLHQITLANRKRAADLVMIGAIAPTNVPPLAHHPGLAEPHVFYRNIDSGHGVAFPASTSDPAAQFALIGRLLGLTTQASGSDGQQSERAARTIDRFHESHPYADPFKLALVNPDDGRFLDGALAAWEQMTVNASHVEEDEGQGELVELPGLVITGYANGNDAPASLKGLDQRRQTSEMHVTKEASDHLRPAFATVLRPVERMRMNPARPSSQDEQHHMIVLQDFSTPQPRPIEHAIASGLEGLALYGLVARYSESLVEDRDKLLWHHWIDTAGSVANHPVDKRLSEALVDGHRAASAASARLLGAEGEEVQAGLSIQFQAEDLDLISSFHDHADWVLTIDRFLGAALFDGATSDRALVGSRTYILDAAPDFQDGLGHRSLVTTSSRQEVESILARAMGQFGFQDLSESVGALIHTLRMVSGRLVLDALRADARASEIVALGAVITWLQNQGQLNDAIVVPVDVHLDLFRPGASDKVTREQRCDLLLFRFRSKSLELTAIEVKGRSSLGDLDTLVETMTAQMDSTSSVIEHRCFNDNNRVDGALQRSSLAHVLRFYLKRAQRYGLINEDKATSISKRIAQLEQDAPRLDVKQLGFVVSHKDKPKQPVIRTDDRTEIRVLTIADISKTIAATPDHDSEAVAAPSLSRTVDRPELDVSPVAENDDAPHAPSSVEELQPRDSVLAEAVDEPLDNKDTATGLNQHQDVELGEANGQPLVWEPRVTGSPHLFILGIPGQGKSVTTENILIQLARSNTPALVLDFHGTFADPNSLYAQAAQPAILDAAKGLPFSPFAIDPFSSWNEIRQHARGIADVIDHVFGLGEIQADAVYTTLRDLYERRGYSDVDEEGPLPATPTLQDVSRALERRAKEQGVRNVLARTRSLFDFDLFQTDAPNTTTFDDLLKGGLVVGLNRLGGEELALAVSGFLLRTVYLSMTRWGVTDRIRLVIVLDEAHKLAKDATLPKLMKEGRKYGIAILVASQGLADFHPDVVGNAGTKVSFRVNHPDSRKVASFFTGRPGQDTVGALEHLGVGQALVQTSEMSHALRAQMRKAE